MSFLALDAPRRPLVVVLALTLVAGAAAFTVPAFAAEGCAQSGGGVRCWTTEREGRAALEGLGRALTDAGATGVTQTCHESAGKRRHAEICEVVSSYRGEPVMISAVPLLLPVPPITFDGTVLVLFATA